MGYTPCPCESDILEDIDRKVVSIAETALNNLRYGFNDRVDIDRFLGLSRIRKAITGTFMCKKGTVENFDQFKTYVYS